MSVSLFMRPLFLYIGQGAYQARDIENCLNVFDVEYQRLCEHDFAKLSSDGLLIVPGGAIGDYLPAWGLAGKETIKAFVRNGGAYIGICAGSYIAGTTFRDQKGIGFFDGELNHTTYQKTVDAVDMHGNSLTLIAENGPDISGIHGDVILKDIDGKPQAVSFAYGKGKVYLFASHPEGSVYYRQFPQESLGAKWFSAFLSEV